MILISEVVWFGRYVEKERSLELERGSDGLESIWKRTSNDIID